MDEQKQSITASGLNVLAGIWLIISPFALGYTLDATRNNNILLGFIVGIIGLIRSFTPKRSTSWLSWLNVLAGIWLIIAPFVLSYATTGQRWNDVVMGIVVIVLSLWSGLSSYSQGNRHAHV